MINDCIKLIQEKLSSHVDYNKIEQFQEIPIIHNTWPCALTLQLILFWRGVKSSSFQWIGNSGGKANSTNRFEDMNSVLDSTEHSTLLQCD